MEYTVTYNVEITDIIRGGVDEEKLMSPELIAKAERFIKESMGSDDVHIYDYKVFPVEPNVEGNA